MGAYAYCDRSGCSMPLKKPTAQEVLAGQRVCPGCGLRQDTRITRDELLLEMIDRIESLEEASMKNKRRTYVITPVRAGG